MCIDKIMIKNAQNQLDRLMTQLSEIETEKGSLDEDEYREMRQETVEQLEDLAKTLGKFECGDMSLLDELSVTKMAIRAAISAAFKTPEVIALFARKQPGLLRERLIMTETKFKLNKIGKKEYCEQKVEILVALRNLNEPLNEEERTFLDEKLATPEFQLQEISSNRVFSGTI